MKKSIFAKIFSGYFLIVLLLSGLILLFSFKTIGRYYLNTLTTNLKNTALTLKLTISPLLEEGNLQELDPLVKRLGRRIKTRITVINPEGIVLADSEKDPRLMENHRDRPEIKETAKGETCQSLRFSDTVKEKMLYVAIPIERDKKIIAILRTSIFLKDIDSLLGNLKRDIVNISLVVIFISLLIAIIFSKGLSRPIKELAGGARKVASGDFKVRVFLKSKDELKELADSFNYMTEKIEALFSDLSLQKEELDSIISSIREPLLVLDSKGKIKLANKGLRKIAGFDNLSAKFYWEVLREPGLDDLIKEAGEKRASFTKEIRIKEMTFLVSASCIAPKEEVILILHDITGIKNLEKVKRDFVTNVSHELKTPLTAIKGYVETLEEEIDQRHQGYLEIIKRHTERLINIVSDLLLLSRLEEKEAGPQFEEVNLPSLIGNALRIFEQRLKEKKLDLRLNIEKGLPSIKGDPFGLEQMLINLIDNAEKYTEKGEIKISLTRQDEQARIEIQDTGIGIPKEDLSRIFERFYVVDKSRSRKLGGTGLGLSIVKHIVLLHNGKIDVKSTAGSGTTFTIHLPLNPS